MHCEYQRYTCQLCVRAFCNIDLMDSLDTRFVDLHLNIANKHTFVNAKNIHVSCVSINYVNLI